MQNVKTFAGTAAALCLAILPAYAGASNGRGAPPSTHANSHAQTTHGNPHTTTPKTTAATHGNPNTTTTSSTGTTTTTTTTPSTSTTPATSGTTTATSTTTTTTNPIAQKLANTDLGTRIGHMLPSTMTLDTASAGFKNQGQFIAAVHVSQNLGIPFANLKTLMLGKTTTGATIAPTSPMSLGQAIQKLKPFANGTTEANRAETQAAGDLRSTTTTTTTTPPSNKKKHGR